MMTTFYDLNVKNEVVENELRIPEQSLFLLYSNGFGRYGENATGQFLWRPL